jgi:hypothetical protein
MRDLLIEKLNKWKAEHHFDPFQLRWSLGWKGQMICKVDYQNLSDEDLLDFFMYIFERI